MPEKITQRARNFAPNLYFNIPFRTRAKYQVERGDVLLCTLDRVVDSSGNTIVNVRREIECPVAKRDGRFYVPPKLIEELNLIGVEYYTFNLRKVRRKDGSEEELYPGETLGEASKIEEHLSAST
jgi:hypothetical protein